MKRVRTRLGAALAAMTLGASALVVMGGPAHAVSNPPTPQLTFSTLIPSHPWPRGSLTGVNANDVEGLVSVPGDNSIWVLDDNRDRIYEIDPTTTPTGGLKSQTLAFAFQSTATQVGSGQLCSDPAQLDPSITGDTAAFECLSRTDDFESIVYNPGTNPGVDDVLYVTSGGCCTAGLPAGYPKHPTVWELTRNGSGKFTPSRWQALPETEDPTAAGWRPGTGMYYGKNKTVRTYDFATNVLGTTITTPSYLVGIDFVDASNVFLTTATPNPALGRTTATSDSTITKYTFSGSSFTEVPGWRFPLKNTGVIDARDMTLINDTFYVSDGYDFRTGSEFNCQIPGPPSPPAPPPPPCVAGDHLIYQFTLGSAPALTAGFASRQQPAPALYSVQFTDTTVPAGVVTSPPTTWAWDFDGNGSTDDTTQSPLHAYTAPGTYAVKLTVTNVAGSNSITKQVIVTGPQWRYEVLNGGSHFVNGNALLKYGTQIQDFYADASHGSLAHSWWDGIRWNFETLDGAGRNTTDVVGTVVEAMQYGTQIQLFYLDATTHTLRHAWWDGARWNFETLDGLGGANGRTTDHVAGGTIAIRQLGAQVQIFYSNDTTHTLRHAWWDGARWNFENFDTGVSLPGAVYVASTQYGTAFHVAFKTSTGTLRHDWWDGTWHNQTLDGPGGVTGNTNDNVGDFVQMTPFGSQLDIAYQDATTSSLRNASSTNGTSSWSFNTLDGSGGAISGHTSNHVGAHISLLPYGGALHLVYQDTTSGALRHAWNDGVWHAEVLDGVGSTKPGATNSTSTGFFSSMIDYGGQLQLTYFDHANGDRLEHAWLG